MWMIVLISLATGQVVYHAPVGAAAYGIHIDSQPPQQRFNPHARVQRGGKDLVEIGCYKFMATIAMAHNKKQPSDPVRAECHRQ
jgi:hypothetical protein